MATITGTVRINNVEYTPQAAVSILNNSGYTDGGRAFDSFPGATDDEKLTEVLRYLSAATRKPPIIMPPRDRTFNVRGRIPIDGMRFFEPYGLEGTKNPEAEGGSSAPYRTFLNVGLGAQSWWNGTGQGNIFAVHFDSMCCQYNTGGQFWSQTSGTLYAARFSSMTHYGQQGVFGNDNEKCLFTQVLLDGHWQVNTSKGVFMNVGGSDNTYFMSGFLNLGGAPGGNGRYLIKSDTNTKTEWGKIYATAHNGWRCIELSGRGQNAFYGGQYEGMNRNTPSDGNLIRIKGGVATFHDTWLAYGMAAPRADEVALVQVDGGANATFYSPVIDRGAMSTEVTAFHASGAGTRLKVVDAKRHAITSSDTWGAVLPIVRVVNGAKAVLDMELNAAGAWVPENVRLATA